MTKTEMAQLLARIQQITGRTFDAATVEAWHDVFGDLDFDDCVDTVNYFGRTQTRFLTIADIVIGAEGRRNHRLAEQRAATEALNELAARAERGDRAEPHPTEDRAADVAALVAQVRSVLPVRDPKVLRYQDPTLTRYEPRAADEPNPHFRGWAPAPPVPGDDEPATREETT